jgi:N-terminal domain of anti-restriction factor ArdC
MKRLALYAAQYAALSAPEVAELDGLQGIATVEGHRLSTRNQWLAAMQRMNQSLSIVGGFRQWEASGRRVKKGEKAFYVLCPMKSKGAQEDSYAASEGAEAGEAAKSLFFREVALFDIGQTEAMATASKTSEE